MFYHGNRCGWQCQFIGVPMLNLFNGACVKMAVSLSMSSHQLLLGYYWSQSSVIKTTECGYWMFKIPEGDHKKFKTQSLDDQDY